MSTTTFGETAVTTRLPNKNDIVNGKVLYWLMIRYPSSSPHSHDISSDHFAISAIIITSPTVGIIVRRPTIPSCDTNAFKSIPSPANSIIFTRAKSLETKFRSTMFWVCRRWLDFVLPKDWFKWLVRRKITPAHIREEYAKTEHPEHFW